MPLENLDLKSCYHLSSFRDVVRSLQQLPLKKLGLSDLRCFSSADLKLIKNFQLEELDLCLNELEDKDLKHHEKLPLKKLDISFSSGVSGKTLRLLSEIKLPLEDLSLSGIELKNTDLKHLRKLPIKHLDLYGNSWLTDKGLNYLANLPLKSLDITGEPGKSKITDASIPILTNLPLEFLRMQNCQKITDKGWEVLMKLPARVMR